MIIYKFFKSRCEGQFFDFGNATVDPFRSPFARHSRFQVPDPKVFIFMELDLPNPFVTVSERERERERERETRASSKMVFGSHF